MKRCPASDALVISYYKDRKPDLPKLEAGLYKFRLLFFFFRPNTIFAKEEINIWSRNWSGMESQANISFPPNIIAEIYMFVHLPAIL